MSQNLDELLFGFDKRIRYVSVLDSMGRAIMGGMRPGLNSLEPNEEAARVDVQMALIRGMSEGASKYLGRTNYVIIHRENLVFLALPREGGRTVLITTQPDFPLERVQAVIEMVESSS
jgi:hypothetical protein